MPPRPNRPNPFRRALGGRKLSLAEKEEMIATGGLNTVIDVPLLDKNIRSFGKTPMTKKEREAIKRRKRKSKRNAR